MKPSHHSVFPYLMALFKERYTSGDARPGFGDRGFEVRDRVLPSGDRRPNFSDAVPDLGDFNLKAR